MKIIVLGGAGYIGSRICRAASARATVVATSSSGAAPGGAYLDLRNPLPALPKLVGEGDIVYVAAALSSPDVCAREPERARAVNVDGTIKAIEAAVGAGARVVFLSSDTVYGERAIPFDEDTDCAPAGAYAQMKREVERHFEGHPGVKVLRLSYVFSRDDKFTRYLERCANAGDVADIYDPFDRSVIHLDDVVAAALALADRWQDIPQQCINLGGPGTISRIAFAQVLSRFALPALRWNVTHPEESFFDSRPRVIAMRSPLLPSLLGRAPLDLESAARIEFSR